jgi:PAS domain S-box-containing protein
VTIHPVLDSAPCGFISVADDGTMLEVNLTLASMLGYARAELLGWHLQKILPPGGRIFYQTHVFPLLKMHGVAEELYLALRTRDGRDIPTLMNAARRERDGALVTDCIFVRMLQRHEFEDQLLQARRLAEEAGAAKAKFLSMMSHDIRTPLTAIAGYAGLAAGGALGPLNEEQLSAMQGIRSACNDLLRLMNDILGFAQLDSGRITVHPVALRVRNIIDRAESLVRLRAEEAGLALRVESCDDVNVHADPERLQQVLLNLLTNAIKFTGPGGTIAVACEAAETSVRIRVRDTGIGIAHEQLERIFDPFVQLDPDVDVVHRGVGLGLSISRDLARAMGGELKADSTPGEGSVFTIELPPANAAADATMQQETT